MIEARDRPRARWSRRESKAPFRREVVEIFSPEMIAVYGFGVFCVAALSALLPGMPVRASVLIAASGIALLGLAWRRAALGEFQGRGYLLSICAFCCALGAVRAGAGANTAIAARSSGGVWHAVVAGEFISPLWSVVSVSAPTDSTETVSISASASNVVTISYRVTTIPEDFARACSFKQGCPIPRDVLTQAVSEHLPKVLRQAVSEISRKAQLTMSLEDFVSKRLRVAGFELKEFGVTRLELRS